MSSDITDTQGSIECEHCGKRYRYLIEIEACRRNDPSLVAPPGTRVRLWLPRMPDYHEKEASVVDVTGPVADTRYPGAGILTFLFVVEVDNRGPLANLFTDQVIVSEPVDSDQRILDEAAAQPDAENRGDKESHFDDEDEAIIIIADD